MPKEDDDKTSFAPKTAATVSSNKPIEPVNLDAKIDAIIEREGTTFTNNPNDKGGPTKFGITQVTLGNYRGHPVGLEEVEALTEAEAREIYKKEYLSKSPFWGFPPQIFDFLSDWSVTSGFDDPARAVQELGNKYGHELKVDGIAGGKTRHALEQMIANNPMRSILEQLIDARILFYAKLAKKDPSQLEFLIGWLNRTMKFRQY